VYFIVLFGIFYVYYCTRFIINKLSEGDWSLTRIKIFAHFGFLLRPFQLRAKYISLCDFSYLIFLSFLLLVSN